MKRNGVIAVVEEYFDLAVKGKGKEYSQLLVEVCDEHGITPMLYQNEPLPAGETRRKILDIHQVRITNVKKAGTRTIELKPGVNFIFGPNDSGKSALLEGVCWAIGGDLAATTGQNDLLHAGASKAEAEVRWQDGVIVRSIERSEITRGKRIGELDWESSVKVEIGGVGAAKAKAASSILAEYLGTNFKFLQASCLVSQGELSALLDEAPGKRRELFYSLLGLSAAEDTRASLAKAMKKMETRFLTQQQQREELEYRLSQTEVSRKRFDLPTLRTEFDRLQSEGPEAEVNVKAWIAKLEVITSNIQTAELNIKRRAQVQTEIADLQKNPNLSKVTKPCADEILVIQRKLDHQIKVAASAERDQEQVKQMGLEVKNLPAVCPQCLKLGWKCGDNAAQKESRLKELREKYHEAAGKAEAEAKELEAVRSKLASLKSQQAEHVVVEMDRDKTRAMIQAKEVILASITTTGRDEIESWRGQAATLQVSIAEAKQKTPGDTAARRADVHKQITECQQLDSQLEWLRTELGKTGTKIDKAQLSKMQDMIDAFSRGGIPLWLARKHVERINQIAGELAEGDTFIYQFNPDLGVDIRDVKQRNVSIPPALASGSSRQRGAVVLRAALGRYLQEMSGIEMPVFWLDEVPFQDAMNAGQVGDVVRRLTKWFPKVVFAASDYERFIGCFDHEISLLPAPVEQTTQELVEALEKIKKDEPAGPPARREPVTKTSSDAAFDSLASSFDQKPDPDQGGEPECPF